MRRQRLDFRAAMVWMEGGSTRPRARKKGSGFPKGESPFPTQERSSPRPSEGWRSRAQTFLAECQEALWSEAGSKARAYLNRRGLRDETLHRFRTGYHPRESFEELEAWGLPEERNARGDLRKVWLPRGIVLPCWTEEGVWTLKIRRPLPRSGPRARGPKYLQVRGGKAGIFNARDLPLGNLALLTEGELDCMLAWQELGDALGVATLGSASSRLGGLEMGIWGRYFLPVTHILAAYDLDFEGEKALKMLANFSERVVLTPLPEREGVKDITDFYLSGGDLWEDWLQEVITTLELAEEPDTLLEGALALPEARVVDLGEQRKSGGEDI